MVLDTVGSIWTTGTKNVRLIQWVQDNADVDVTLADCEFSVDQTAVTLKIDRHDTAASADENDVIKYQAGPFNPGIPVHSFVLTTLDAGVIHIWVT